MEWRDGWRMERHVWSGWLGWVLGDRDGVGEAAIRTHGNSYVHVVRGDGWWAAWVLRSMLL